MPTENQKIVFNKVMDKVKKGEKVILRNEMEGIYRTASSKLTRSKGWNELMEQHLPDADLSKVHKEGLNATKTETKLIGVDEDGKPIYKTTDVKDFSTRHRYLDTAYKLKSKYPNPANVNINLSISDLIKENLKRKYESIRDSNNNT